MIDLNLFPVFDTMTVHRSVRKASQILSVTPSAVSHALSRLRQSIGDELFIPTESGMQPTERALELASAVREGLEKLALSDMVALLPRRFALWAAAHAPLALLDPPHTSIAVEIEMLWVEGADQDEALQWLLNGLGDSIGELG